jgi:hypothetical protein
MELGVCPVCKSLVATNGLENGAMDMSSGVVENPQCLPMELLSLADYRAALKEECQALAAENGIDLKESFFRNLAEASAFDQYLRAREALPEVSAYRSRNVLPLAALGWLALGALIAIPAALVMELLVSLFAAGVIAFAAWSAQAGGRVLIVVFLALLTCLAPFIAGGYVCARVIARFGRRGKNRDRWVAGFLASAAAATTVLILWAAHRQFSREPFQEWDPFKMGPNLDGFTNFFFGTNFLVATVSGACFAKHIIGNQRFCDKCQELMEPLVSKDLCAGTIKAMLCALERGSIPLVASLSEGKGSDGTISLNRCAVCGSGILEITVSIEAVSKGFKHYAPSWCVAVVNLKKQEVDWFAATAAEVN